MICHDAGRSKTERTSARPRYGKLLVMMATPDASPRAPRLPPACFALFLAVFFCAFAQISMGLVPFEFGPGFEVTNVARHLAVSGELSDPFSIPTGSTAHVAPVYTAVMALVFKIFGYTYSAALVMAVFNAALLATVSALLPVLSQRVFAHPAPGIAGGILLILAGKLNPTSEAAFSAVLLLSTTLILMSRGKLASGFSAAASILTTPVSVLPVVVIGMHRGRRWFAGTGALALILCIPWIARNYLVLGAPYFIRDNFGLELFLSNQDRAAPEMAANYAIRFHPTGNPDEAAQVAALGEGPYNGAKLRMALGWTRSHPWSFVSLSAARVFRYWFPSRDWVAYGYWLINLLAIVGVWLARRNSTALLLVRAAVFYSLPYAVIQASPKYGYPMLWVSALLAGYAIRTILSGLGVSATTGRDLAHEGASIADRPLRMTAIARPDRTKYAPA